MMRLVTPAVPNKVFFRPSIHFQTVPHTIGEVIDIFTVFCSLEFRGISRPRDDAWFTRAPNLCLNKFKMFWRAKGHALSSSVSIPKANGRRRVSVIKMRKNPGFLYSSDKTPIRGQRDWKGFPISLISLFGHFQKKFFSGNFYFIFPCFLPIYRGTFRMGAWEYSHTMHILKNKKMFKKGEKQMKLV